MRTVLIFLLLFPLGGALYQVFPGRRLPRQLAEAVACATLLAALGMAVIAFFLPSYPESITLYDWIRVDELRAGADLRYDGPAAVMALMVTFVASLIQLYSVSYMRRENGYARYFCYLNLFVFFMLVIVLADNLLFLFLGWEGVGFCSYALIGFWYEDPANATAGRKAFLLTRIGDIGFAIAIGLFFATCHTLSISGINAQAGLLNPGTALLLGLLLLWAATGKSAQLPLLVWLPDAMAGPTPVSALIHAATMVTAGVYLLIRLFPIIALSPDVLAAIAIVGTVTALYGACAALVQRDIKRVLAYSTISQVGYMFLAVGVGDPAGSMFHLLTHGFFKSLLFLAAGCVIHALHGEHDILKMGETVRRHLPTVFLLFLTGGLALGGVPPSAGFFSKGRILLATLGQGNLLYQALWVLATFTALLTTLYIFRLLFLVFTGPPVIQHKTRFAPVPALMMWTLWPLALLALVAGALNLPRIQEGGGWLVRQLADLPALKASSSLEWKVENGDSLLAIIGLVLAYFLYGPRNILNWRAAEPFGRQGTAVLFTGFGLDRLYDILIKRPYIHIARFLWITVDEEGLDEGLVRLGRIFPALAGVIRQWTTGRLTTNLRMLVVGFAALLVFLSF